jgi:hypothetical protein
MTNDEGNPNDHDKKAGACLFVLRASSLIRHSSFW